MNAFPASKHRQRSENAAAHRNRMEQIMKKQILNAVVTLSVIAALTIAGFAGLSGNLVADIPFDFIVKGKKLPAGKYTVETGSFQSALAIRSFTTKQAAVSITQNFQVRAGSKPRLIFHRYGDQYFLAKVVTDSVGKELPKSNAEREAAKARRDILAKMDTEPEIVIVHASMAVNGSR